MTSARTVLAVLAASAVITSGTMVTADAATPALSFRKIQYDPSGPDRPVTNRQLDREWVTIRNTSRVTRQLKGLRVHDAQHHVYVFKALALRAGASVRLHTGRGHNTRTDVYWGQRNYVWNNDSDIATLATAAGRKLDSCRWTRDGSGSIVC